MTKYVHDTFHSAWDVAEWDRVPTDDDAIGLANKGVRIDAAVLYADLADSTGLVKSKTDEYAAEIYKSYVYAASKSIRAHEGVVTAFDGDRVMGLFVGGSKRNHAAEAAFHLAAIVEDILQPELEKMYGNSSYTITQKVGIDASKILVSNTGMRGTNDYVWVGTAANNAAKMAALKLGYTTYATSEVLSVLNAANTTAASDGNKLWHNLGTSDLGFQLFGTNARKVNI